MRIVKVYTGQIYTTTLDHELGKVYDVTVKTGLRYLAPNWDSLIEYKNNPDDINSVINYTKKYNEKLKHAFSYFQREIDEMLLHESIILGCYCYADKFCHRHLLASALVDYALARNINVVLCGEITRKGVVELCKNGTTHFHDKLIGMLNE